MGSTKGRNKKEEMEKQGNEEMGHGKLVAVQCAPQAHTLYTCRSSVTDRVSLI